MSINTNNFYMVPKELFQTDLTLSQIMIYSRMLDDSSYYEQKYGQYAPSRKGLAAYINSDREATAGDILKDLLEIGLITTEGKKYGGRIIYKVIDWHTFPHLITKPPIKERREIRKPHSINDEEYGNRISQNTETAHMSNYNNHTFNINHTDKKEIDTEKESDNIGIPDHKPQSKNNDLSQCTNQQSITQCLTDSNPLSQCFTSSDSAYQYLVDNGCIVDRSTFNSTFNIRGTYVCPDTGLYVRRTYS